MQRTLLAALVGGIVVFAWGAFSHTVLPLGNMGISAMAGDAEVIALLKAQSPASGTYFLPEFEKIGADDGPAAGPAAFVAWQPEVPYTMGTNLAVEFASNVLAAFVAAWVVGCYAAGGSILCRASAVMAMGVFGWLSISASHWNWYGFSDGMLVGEGLDQAIGWFLAGLAMAPLLRPRV
jgi:hypothetical protein